MNTESKLAALIHEGNALVAKADGRDLTQAEVTRLTAIHDQATVLKADLIRERDSDHAREMRERSKKANDMVAAMLAAPGSAPAYAEALESWPSTDANDETGTVRLNLASKNVGYTVANRAEQRGGGVKGVLDAGTTATVPVEVVAGAVPQGRPALSVMDLVPAIQVKDGSQISYLVQTGRQSNAAPVSPGADKPVSDFTLKRVNDELQVVAHVVEGLNKYDIQDSPALARFVSDELMWGLGQALEHQLVNGSGVQPQLNGILATSGVQQQPYVSSPVVTIRHAIGKLQANGYDVNAVLLNPNDWLAIETTQLTDGAFLLGAGPTGAPIDAAERRLWGVRVGLTNQLAAGTAIILSKDSLALFFDRSAMIELDPYTGFRTNTLRARAELRAQTGVLRPAGIAVADLTA